MKPHLLRIFRPWRAISILALAFFMAGSRAGEVPIAFNAGDGISLNGVWETGIDRNYSTNAIVPGLAQSPNKVSPGVLWYRRTVKLPEGNWTCATLDLGGARFAPAVYVDGEKVSASEGGMAPTEHVLKSAHIAPGKTIHLEIALQSLKDLSRQDASAVPDPDRWRADISSSLWDSVRLHFSGDGRISRIVPWTDYSRDSVSVHWETDGANSAAQKMQALILDQSGAVLASSVATSVQTNKGVTELYLNHACQPWSPESPNVYRLKLVLSANSQVQDSREITWGLRDFRTQGVGLMLNNAPVQLRGGTVVWHRWVRDPEAATLAFDPGWFETNLVLRLKGLGANFLRFHLGLPPEEFFDLCDRHGLLVQLEWPFFHGVKASVPSMEKQWRDWLDVGMRHPSVVVVHPWNETEGNELDKAWRALNNILPEYPPLVIAHRDVIPLHRYWWSLFENLGLYYDSAAQFDHPILADEFGGNYLDDNGDPGLYPTTRETFLRFLGRDHTRERRLHFQAEANGRVGEYWRRIGAAGIAPFCALASHQDGNNWFLGGLAEANPKPVWAALAATFAPCSVSLDVWDRNYSPGQTVSLPLYFFNDAGESKNLQATVRIVSTNEVAKEIFSSQTVEQTVPAHGKKIIDVKITMPVSEGEWRLEAELTNPPTPTTAPIISAWDCRTLDVKVPPALNGVKVGVAANDSELSRFLSQYGIRTVALDDPQARVLVTSAPLWKELTQSPSLKQTLQNAVNRGQSVVLLDIGPRDLGPGYKKGLGQFDGPPKIQQPRVEHADLFSGVRLTFTESVEPESHFHPAQNDSSLWNSLPRESTWLWNGLRGGLVVPTADMAVDGLNAEAFLSLWSGRGADGQAIRSGDHYYAYELAGYYAFSAQAQDLSAIARLHAKVKQLAEDAPAIQDRLNLEAPIQSQDLAQTYRQTATAGKATQLIALASCGKNLTRIPVVELEFGSSKGKVILSQLLTAGRLVRGHQEPGFYGIRYDPAADQFVLNLIAKASR